MKTSIEKVEEFIEELQEPPTPDADALELTMKSVVHIGRPLLDQVLPDDPELLDQYLEHIAGLVLRMRSDQARQLVIASDDEVIDGDVAEEQRELPAG